VQETTVIIRQQSLMYDCPPVFPSFQPAALQDPSSFTGRRRKNLPSRNPIR
jgi:hypothetical protein